jgi:hypothetical protein
MDKCIYVLLAGADYYPSSRCGDWVGIYRTKEEAWEALENSPSAGDWRKVVEINTETLEYN